MVIGVVTMEFPRKEKVLSPPWGEGQEEDETLYHKEFREQLVEEGSLRNEEDAFMLGYEEGLEIQDEEEYS